MDGNASVSTEDNAPVSLDDSIDNSTSVDDVASVSLDDDALDNNASVFGQQCHCFSR